MSHKLDLAPSGSPVAQFYNNRTIFITGATGFMGKVLVEKLLRCTNVRQLFLLIRPKKGISTLSRLQDLLAGQLFDSLRENRPHMLSRVRAVEGDITEPSLGLSQEDEGLLMSEVSVVFHSAATVKFDEALTKSVAMNVESVLSIINLAKKMQHLEALVHVSTAYCNCDLETIEERVYPAPGSPHGIIQLCKVLDEEVINSPEVTARLIGNRPNTYTFTKALAENILATEGTGLPIAIVRPSIVSAGWNEPMPGWVDNMNGPTGILAGALKGLLRTLYCRRAMHADLVPVDVPISLMCCVAWCTAQQQRATSITCPPRVYNCTSGSLNPLRWGEFEAWGYEAVHLFPSEQMFWRPGGSLKDSHLGNRICQVMFHYGPAYLFDSLARLLGKKPLLVKIYDKMHKGTKALEYFTTHEWEWTNTNTIALQGELTKCDREVFNFDVSQIQWSGYIHNYVKGVREFVFKEKKDSLADSRKLLNRMTWLERSLQMVMFLMFWRVVLYRSESFGRCCNFLLNFLLSFLRLLPVDTEL